jgi:aryl-alcohol dehydrogenase-like predicted oxidoreductase
MGPKQPTVERRLDAIEQLISVAQEAEEAGMSLTLMAMAFVMAHPGIPRRHPPSDRNHLARRFRCKK